MDTKEILEQARDVLTVGRVFGQPIERNGTLVIPVASVRGGAGAGSGQGEPVDQQAPGGGGGGWAATAKPAGVYVIRGDRVDWQPAIDVNRIILGGQIAFIVGLLVLRSVLKRRRRL
jgi:uncharacterized spore protein YtfJ